MAISHTLREDGPSEKKYGPAHKKLGVRSSQHFKSGKLRFKSVGRTDSTSIYQAANYGPSLKYLNILVDSVGEDGRGWGIPVIRPGDPDSELMAQVVEDWLKKSRHYSRLKNMATASFTSKEVDDLGVHGLNPARYRRGGKKLKRAFLRKLLPDAPGNPRVLTARLIVATLGRRKTLNVESLRDTWHTGMFPGGSRLVIKDPGLEDQRKRWALFCCRQYQRFIIEWFLQIFEDALKGGKNSIDSITEYALDSAGLAAESTLRKHVASACRDLSRSKDIDKLSTSWVEKVHSEHERFDWIYEDNIIQMTVKWVLRMGGMKEKFSAWSEGKELFSMGGQSRFSMEMFYSWVKKRMDWPLGRLVKGVFEQLVFAQHLKVALIRLDGKNQRLRFSLDDNGITPSMAFIDKMPARPNFMPDRLDAFVHLLCDAGALQESANGALQPGDLVDCITG